MTPLDYHVTRESQSKASGTVKKKMMLVPHGTAPGFGADLHDGKSHDRSKQRSDDSGQPGKHWNGFGDDE